MSHAQSGFGLDRLSAELHAKWGWFVALGIALIVLGGIAFADLFAATVASVLIVGALMIIGAIGQVINAIQVKNWRGFLYWLLSGLFYGAAGVLTFYNPLLAAAALTLLLAFSLIVAGALRVWSSIRFQPEAGWGWFMASGIVTIVVGIILVAGWPANTLWLLGLVLAIDLIFQGVAAAAFGMALKANR